MDNFKINRIFTTCLQKLSVMKVAIANPIYDVVFKYTMEDNEVALFQIFLFSAKNNNFVFAK